MLPDGRRFVVDYWDAINTRQPELQPQTSWVNKWRERVGPGAVLSVSDDEVSLKKAVARSGEDKGIAAFRKQAKGAKAVAAEVWIESWKREPW